MTINLLQQRFNDNGKFALTINNEFTAFVIDGTVNNHPVSIIINSGCNICVLTENDTKNSRNPCRKISSN